MAGKRHKEAKARQINIDKETKSERDRDRNLGGWRTQNNTQKGPPQGRKVTLHGKRTEQQLIGEEKFYGL